eukprot:jgi/Picsp_1/6374/NSC_03722-R1_---NA---
MRDQSTLVEEQGRPCSPDLDQISNELDRIRILGDVCEQKRRLHEVSRKLEYIRNTTESTRARDSHSHLSDSDRARLNVLRSIVEKMEENIPVVPEPDDNEPESNEVVGDIDDMLANLDIDRGSDERRGQGIVEDDYLMSLNRERDTDPLGSNVIPGRRYRRVIRSSVGGAGKPRCDTAAVVRSSRRCPQDESDGTAYAQNPVQGQIVSLNKKEDSSLEQNRYRRHAPQPHLDVEIPISKAEIAAAVAPRKDSMGDMGSSGSTHAQRYGAEPSDSESDESITSPDALQPGGTPPSFG